MTISNPKMISRERDSLNITAKDLKEFEDPLNNILLDVMFESLYPQKSNQQSEPKEN
jgi:hypothetical protein